MKKKITTIITVLLILILSSGFIFEKSLTKKTITIKVKDKHMNLLSKKNKLSIDSETGTFYFDAPAFSLKTELELYESMKKDSTYKVHVYGWLTKSIFEIENSQ